MRAAARLFPMPVGVRKLHWRQHDDASRAKLVDLVRGLGVDHLVIRVPLLRPRSQERARRLCLERLLFELDTRGCALLVLEERTASLNDKDIAAATAFHVTGVVSKGLYVLHRAPETEPMLWIADVIVGAYSVALRGQPTYREVLASLGTEIAIPSR